MPGCYADWTPLTLSNPGCQKLQRCQCSPLATACTHEPASPYALPAACAPRPACTSSFSVWLPATDDTQHAPPALPPRSLRTEACLHFTGKQIAAACIWLTLKLLKEDSNIYTGATSLPLPLPAYAAARQSVLPVLLLRRCACMCLSLRALLVNRPAGVPAALLCMLVACTSNCLCFARPLQIRGSCGGWPRAFGRSTWKVRRLFMYWQPQTFRKFGVCVSGA